MKKAFILASVFFLSGEIFSQQAPPSGKTKYGTSEKTVIIKSEPSVKTGAKKKTFSPEEKALAQLNTVEVPADFPKYNSTMDAREYENRVAKWFTANPDKRKKN